MSSFQIRTHTLGIGHPVYIIAEAGVNHNGDIERAKTLIRAAKDAGADCIKFQTFQAKNLVVPQAPKAPYQFSSTNPNETQYDMLSHLELDRNIYPILKSLCDDLKIDFLSTPYDIKDIDFLDDLGVDAFKIASIHIVEPEFICHVAQKNKPIILSTGMATLAEVSEAVSWIRESGNNPLVLLQCTSNYPARVEDSNLLAMQTMQYAFQVPVGYSDHTQGDITSIAAVSLGACIIEKHFTLNKKDHGPDHFASVEPLELKNLITKIREVEKSLGSTIKRPCQAELININYIRRSIFSKVSIKAGEMITREKLTVKRPVIGLRPSQLREIIGRIALVEIQPDEAITWEMCGQKIFPTIL
ncbi:MAG: N-acetylneuraminate synthase [Desulfobacterales bacterium]|nr:N-acetylneuraminate synthase [Desulfobacterales bacterium]